MDPDHPEAFAVSCRKKAQILDGWNTISTAGYQLPPVAPSGYGWYISYFDIFEPGNPSHAAASAIQIANAVYDFRPYSEHPLN
jgi:hypothetical protein